MLSAAVDRRTASGAVVAIAERISPAEALAGYLGGGRVVPGAAADLLVRDRPLAEQLAHRRPTPWTVLVRGV